MKSIYIIEATDQDLFWVKATLEKTIKVIDRSRKRIAEGRNGGKKKIKRV
jgi:hypothetical protein